MSMWLRGQTLSTIANQAANMLIFSCILPWYFRPLCFPCMNPCMKGCANSFKLTHRILQILVNSSLQFKFISSAGKNPSRCGLTFNSKRSTQHKTQISLQCIDEEITADNLKLTKGTTIVGIQSVFVYYIRHVRRRGALS